MPEFSHHIVCNLPRVVIMEASSEKSRHVVSRTALASPVTVVRQFLPTGRVQAPTPELQAPGLGRPQRCNECDSALVTLEVKADPQQNLSVR